jgi:hypothetical protein
MMINLEQSTEWELAEETEILGENLPIAILSTTNHTWLDPGLNPCRRAGKPATNRLSYDAAECEKRNCCPHVQGGNGFCLLLLRVDI